MPDLNRPNPPYVQIADHYRARILNGDLAPGARIPSVSAIAREWRVAAATAAKAISRLSVEGAIYTSPRGSFVSSDEIIARPPGERIRMSGVRPSGTVEVTAADIVTALDYVAALLGIPPGEAVIRREEITHGHGRRRMLAVDWIPGISKEVAEELLQHAPVLGGPEGSIERLTGRRVTHVQDHLRGRGADAREASALAITTGSPVLAGVHVWSDDDGVLLYGEWVMPPDQVVSYAYSLAGPGDRS